MIPPSTPPGQSPPTPPRGPGSPSGVQRAVAARTARTVPRRRVLDHVMRILTYVATALAVLPLVLILGYLINKGASALSVAFFTETPRPVGAPGGGMGNGILGTGILVALACAFGFPVGIGAGLYLAEHPATRLATAVRFLSDVLNGLPSIVIGIFAWQILVRPVGHFSALAGGVALAVIMIPLLARTTEEMVRTVPGSLREAALALGYPRWRTSLGIVFRTALPGVVTGALIAVARVAGETAPLLFTAFGNQYWSRSVTEPIAALPLQIFTYAISPYEEWHAQAWAGALVLIGLVFFISLAARFTTRAKFGTVGD